MPPNDNVRLTHVDPLALRPGLRLEPLRSDSVALSDDEIDAAIAETLNSPDLPDPPAPAPAPVRRERPGRARAARRSVPEAEAVPVAETVAETVPDLPDPEPARAAFQPIDPPDMPRGRALRRRTVRLTLIAAAVLAVIIWPLIVPVLLIGTIWLGLIAVIFVGTERIAGLLLGAYRWLDARAPHRAERLRARADGLACRLDTLFDRLPGRWTEGLYMPDFSREALRDAPAQDAPDPFDRLQGEAGRS